ncbi:hypothetical protein [Paraburkholderia susongensis]|uniref:hypothetical protein n=1 Tax=Paraburkholderia susongensis TaxID=1515439 RepID=UPI000A1C83CD|nr:hypothetical protein [Paraburkholderia susongensis]
MTSAPEAETGAMTGDEPVGAGEGEALLVCAPDEPLLLPPPPHALRSTALDTEIMTTRCSCLIIIFLEKTGGAAFEVPYGLKR